MDTRDVLLKYLTSPERSLEGGIKMPFCSRFFIPKQEFIDWCKKNYAQYGFVDCGAGIGHVAKALRESGLHAIAIDLYPSDEMVIDDCFEMSAPMYPFMNDNVALLCRPCRGTWIHATIIKAISSGCDLIYVGKQEHYEKDLAPLPYSVTKIMEDAGEDGETVWLVKRQ